MSAARAAGPAPANAAVRGAALIVAAIAIGALLLAQGFSDDGGLIAATPDTDDTATDDGTTEPTDPEAGIDDTDPDETVIPSTEAAPVVRPPEETRYIVLNGSSVDGAAASVSTELAALNYVGADPGDVGLSVETSQIFYVEGWQAEAEKVAADLGVGPELAAPLPAPFELPDTGDVGIIVVLGTDGVISP
ncbi:MAG: LytR C-terminal domain-containing protein [Acidimicrobiia bacterium]|nr:LytR C-terminal domain-containing protein [Acidimicrobiia bacterium]